ncbi:hypothetical protein [Leptolyngbya sp. FACHB-261]|uniref:hypothetical protein n=1 Tax=Leptolyngbya sp. FACHB-261 TaxID=2692806 RepID=UPI001682CA48|nr:hypothetical protein [Leptolyngbya sp. FACHB-261]MBD2101782.1 hypothetical protein [Leptolyngbya sp. FACHB-261]
MTNGSSQFGNPSLTIVGFSPVVKLFGLGIWIRELSMKLLEKLPELRLKVEGEDAGNNFGWVVACS